MKNNLNEKNKSISKSKSKSKNKTKNKTKNIVLINEEQINIIPSHSIIKAKSINKSKTNSKKSQQRRSNNIQASENVEFPKGDKYKCIGPCYPANKLYYHPLTLQAIKNNTSTCATQLYKIDNNIKIHDKCILNENYNYDNYDLFSDVIQIAMSDNIFLEQIYNIKNIVNVELFLDNDIKQLPILSQKRILNSIYRVYRDYDSFPNKNFISPVKNFIKYNSGINIKSKEIISIIMENKHKKIWEDLFENLVK
jgi:hypothetical protein